MARGEGALRVLVVDDEPMMRTLTHMRLTAAGLDVVMAADAEHALEMLPSVAPDVVLCDVSMPRVGGVEFVRRVRGGSARPPILLYSSHDPEADVRSVMGLAAVEYASKSVPTPDLVSRLHRLGAPAA